MTSSDEPITQSCPSCGALIDISDEEPLATILCPICGAEETVCTTIDHFELKEVVGAGGMGVVYKALDTSLIRLVALKLLRKEQTEDAELIAKLAHEAAVTASINHPYVVKVFSTGMDRGRFYIAMELVDKGTLDKLIELQTRVAEAQVLEVGTQIAQGLRAAHQAGLIHRDVKPGNILFADAHTAKIVDFGLAIFMEDEAATRGEVWGTPYYVAPEKLDNKPEDFRSDQYSLGGTLFHALAGRPPFEAEEASMVALKHLKSQAVSLQAFAPHVSNATAYVINRTLSKDPEQRYQSYDEMIEHLEYARAELLQKGAQPPRAKRVVIESMDQQKAISWVVMGMLGVIVALAVLGFVFRKTLFPDRSAPAPVVDLPAAVTPEAKSDLALALGRTKLLDGDTAGATTVFSKAAQTKGVVGGWAALHETLALLMQERIEDARAAARKVGDGKGDATADPKVAAFLAATAKRIDNPSPIKPASVKIAEKNSYEAFSLLLFALKNWNASRIEDAVVLFRQFRAATPAGQDAWIAELKPLVGRYMEQFATFEMAANEARDAKTAAKRMEAVEKLQALKEPLALRAREVIAQVEELPLP